MKKLLSLFICALGLTCYGQGLTLNAGDTWSIEFTNLPFLNTRDLTSAMSPFPEANFMLNLSGYDPAVDSIRYQTFENSLSGTPLFDSSTFPGLTYGATSGGALRGWQDLQGWIRLTVISGSVTLNSVQVDINDSWEPGKYPIADFWQKVFEVPEPHTSALLILMMLVPWICRRNRQGNRA